ncbi:DUF2075 domain-containing protein [Bacteroidota bacterium]|nr:DUF2075 domain-containing protein [Bacteroidota bacterium]
MSLENVSSMFQIDIKTFSFNKHSINYLQEGTDDLWPIVYLIEDSKRLEAYIGESTDVYRRMTNHLQNPIRKDLSKVHLISSKSFNKSATLDIESRLIKYIAADGHFKLQNGNAGLTFHNYFQKDKYEDTFEQIWQKLENKNLVKNNLKTIINSDLFKYSPYKSLTHDQLDSVIKIAENIKLKKKGALFVIGGAGTGKTVLGTYLAKLLKSDLSAFDFDNLDDNHINLLKVIQEIYKQKENLEIGFVIPQQSLRQTIKKVFKYVKGLSSKMVISANDVIKKEDGYDLIIVDEAHRLRRRKNLPGGFAYKAFDNACEKLNLNPETTDELDWILKRSKQQILFYDSTQSIKPTDIKSEKFSSLINKDNSIKLKSQLRVLGGNDYINYVNDILLCKNPKRIEKWGKYKLKLHHNFMDFVNDIKNLNSQHGLCRMISGYSWKWETKLNKQNHDIEIEGVKLKWNTTDVDWINKPSSVDEVGCIHTSQGYDLNYGGIIFGREIDYNPKKNKIIINKDLYFDANGKKSVKSEDELKNYIINIYKTMMYRGIKGTTIYVYNKDLRDYFNRFF